MDEGKVEFDLLIEPSDVDLSARFASLLETSRFRGYLRKEDWIVSVSGYFKAAIERVCDRCLSKSEIELAVNVERAYVEFKKLDEEREIELDVRGLEYSLIETEQLNLREVFEEHLLLAIPDKFVCEAG
ncbi:MAG: DUF177 domain-containing protein, partial [Acidobacteriota bacterium]|nr:DUF177 domain-containing protein [Acidobacteriota bacterium]